MSAVVPHPKSAAYPLLQSMPVEARDMLLHQRDSWIHVREGALSTTDRLAADAHYTDVVGWPLRAIPEEDGFEAFLSILPDVMYYREYSLVVNYFDLRSYSDPKVRKVMSLCRPQSPLPDLVRAMSLVDGDLEEILGDRFYHLGELVSAILYLRADELIAKGTTPIEDLLPLLITTLPGVPDAARRLARILIKHPAGRLAPRNQ